MKSNKQKRVELAQRKSARAEKRRLKQRIDALPWIGPSERVNSAALAPNASYSEPDYVRRGYYEPVPFVCRDCGVEEVWTARQQKWWYEIAKGAPFTTATRCRACRRRERDRRAAARKIHLDGVANKAERKSTA